MIYLIGIILGKRFRVWYWRTFKHRWYWGLARCIEEIPVVNRSEFSERYEEFLNGILK